MPMHFRGLTPSAIIGLLVAVVMVAAMVAGQTPVTYGTMCVTSLGIGMMLRG